MKRLFPFLPVLLIISYTTYGQNQEDTPEKKVYRAEDNKLYINKDLGIYIWLSTSPDPDSKKFRLMSDSTHKYTNPMYFDSEGYNTFRSPWCVDTTTRKMVYPKQDIIFEVYADGLPPVTKASYESSLAQNIAGKKYYGSDLKVRLKSTDVISGIASVKYNMNGKGLAEYKDELTGFNEGENTIDYYGIDRVGNKEDVNRDIFFIDNTPPKTEYEIEGNRNDKYVSADATIKLTATDNFSGVKTTYYKLNNAAFTRYTVPIPVKILTNDEASISYYSEDNLGNKEAVKSIGGKQNNLKVEGSAGKSGDVIFEFYIDKDPPQLSVEIDKDIYKAKQNFISPRSQIRVAAEDEKSGVDKVFYSIDNALVDQLYSKPLTVEKTGTHIIRIKAMDYVGNTSPLLTRTYICDAKAPVSKITFGTPKFFSRDTLFITPLTPVALSAVDDLSGVSSIRYAIGGTETLIYSKPFNIINSGINTLSVSATDNVNNEEIPLQQAVFVDDQPPSIIYNFSVESIGSKQVRDETYIIYPTNVMLYIAVTDANSGGEKINYRINNGPVLTENPVKGFTQGNYIVHVNAYDMLGNKSTQEIKFAIEK